MSVEVINQEESKKVLNRIYLFSLALIYFNLIGLMIIEGMSYVK